MQHNELSLDLAPPPFLRSLLIERTHSEPLRAIMEPERVGSPTCTEPDTSVMVDSRGNAACDMSKVRSQPDLPALLAQEATGGLNRAQSHSHSARTRKRSWAGLRPAELKTSMRLPRRFSPSPGGSSAQGSLLLGDLQNAASSSREEDCSSQKHEASPDRGVWAAKSNQLPPSRMASGTVLDDPMDTELTPSQKIIAELLAQHAVARAQGRPIVTPGRHSKPSSPAGGASNRSSLTGAPEMLSPFSLQGAKQRAMSSGSDHLPHARPHASLSVTGRSISRSQLASSTSAQLSPASSLSQPMSSMPTRSSLDMTHHSFASPFSSGSIANRESFTGHSQSEADAGNRSGQMNRKAVHDCPTRDFSSLGLTLRDGSEGLRPCPIGLSSFSSLTAPQWPLLSSVAQPTEPAFASLLEPLVPPDLPFDVLDWDPLSDLPFTESPVFTGGSTSSNTLIPAWPGLRGSIGSEMSEMGQISNNISKDQPQQMSSQPDVHERPADVGIKPSWQIPALPPASTAIMAHDQPTVQPIANPSAFRGKIDAASIMPSFDEAHVLEDLYLNTPGFTSMLEELASNDSMQQDETI
ncbi:hypothetical protein WJX74_004782 [Apatococcus lobatus]|uniref:Uncharacterized protein n=1 Tax=Apatococcus lobatus TaxID=904363 RepID=A0AAW1RQ74_9CHLO